MKLRYSLTALVIVFIGGIFVFRNRTRTQAANTDPTTTFSLNNKDQIYVYAKRNNLHGVKKRPLVIFMHGTGGDPQREAIRSGWVAKAKNSNLIVISPTYDDYITYQNVPYITRIINYAKRHYAVDSRRIYSVGFSNGGATSIALASRHPKLLAGISAYGWANNMERHDTTSLIPFQFISGTREATEYTSQGNPMVRVDIRHAIDTLFTYNQMRQANMTANYKRTPYWGYVPDSTSQKEINKTRWTFNNYHKAGFKNPFAQFIMIDGATHTQHRAEAEYTWNFLRHFSRNSSGKLVEN